MNCVRLLEELLLCSSHIYDQREETETTNDHSEGREEGDGGCELNVIIRWKQADDVPWLAPVNNHSHCHLKDGLHHQHDWLGVDQGPLELLFESLDLLKNKPAARL